MISDLKEALKNFFTSRLFVLGVVIFLLFAIVIGRVFSLQIINGKEYQENFTLRIQKDITLEAARGNIYDCEGRLLAYNELAYSVVISDNSSYSSTSAKNLELNSELATVITMLLKNNETIYNTFGIDYNAEDGSYSFNVSGSALKRFLADVFGESSYDDLSYNEDFGFNEANATAAQVMDFMMHDSDMYGVNLEATDSNPDPVQYDEEVAYYIVVLRYALSANRYSRYKPTVIAKDVSDSSVAYVNEHSDTLSGVAIEEDTIRVYNYSEYFSNIIGYTGTISESEYEELSATDDSYTINDTIGRSGLEQYYESYLRGQNGEQSVYVDSVGRVLDVISETDAVAGDDVYLSLDAELQMATYELLEQEIAGIVYSNIVENNIPITDVYYALINNDVIDVDHFSSSDASDTEKKIQAVFSEKQSSVLSWIEAELYSETPTANNDMDEELLDYITYIIKMLKEDEILNASSIDTSDETYLAWKNGEISPEEYLRYCISSQWIDITLLNVEDKYADTSEVYEALVDYILDCIADDIDFSEIIYQYLVDSGSVSGKDLCVILFDQGVLDYDDNTVSGLESGSITPYNFLLEKIDNIEITPAQLALDPCTGSCVITDVNTGEIKALVSYPGYDNNRMANGVDADYYATLQSDLSNPLYNYATQEKTACGSTFKMVTSTAGMAEGVITTDSQIQCTGIFTLVDNTPKCWVYPSNHGSINVSEALRDSCNCFFYTVGYDLSTLDMGVYDDASGISYLTKYASAYGLDEKTGIEIEENTPEIATEYPVMAAIGQSNNNYTTVSLSRYVTAVVSGNLYDYQLMNKIVDHNGDTVAAYEPSYSDVKDLLNTYQWNAIYSGMRMVCENLECFDDCAINVAGKTGTAQQVESRPNHALFVGYAPYEDPEISIAVRIAYGYSSHNAAGAAKNIISYYFGTENLEDILAQKASGANTSSSTTFTD